MHEHLTFVTARVRSTTRVYIFGLLVCSRGGGGERGGRGTPARTRTRNPPPSPLPALPPPGQGQGTPSSPPPQAKTRTGYPLPLRLTLDTTRYGTGYAACDIPLAFTQEACLVELLFRYFVTLGRVALVKYNLHYINIFFTIKQAWAN